MPQTRNETVKIHIKNIILEGEIVIPQNSKGVIIFSEFTCTHIVSLRNKLVAQVLNKSGFATVQVELNSKVNKLVLNDETLPVFTSRISGIVQFIRNKKELEKLPLGFFCTSAGLYPVLHFISKNKNNALAVVGRGIKSESVNTIIDPLNIPVLLINGELDQEGIEISKKTLESIIGPKQLKVVTGASHYFNELGKLGEVAYLSSEWFKKHLTYSTEKSLQKES